MDTQFNLARVLEMIEERFGKGVGTALLAVTCLAIFVGGMYVVVVYGAVPVTKGIADLVANRPVSFTLISAILFSVSLSIVSWWVSWRLITLPINATKRRMDEVYTTSLEIQKQSTAFEPIVHKLAKLHGDKLDDLERRVVAIENKRKGR